MKNKQEKKISTHYMPLLSRGNKCSIALCYMLNDWYCCRTLPNMPTVEWMKREIESRKREND